MDYQTGIQRLLQHVPPRSTQHEELLVLQYRLTENLKSERIYGTTETIRAERAAIIYALNTIALVTAGVSFNDLTRADPPGPAQPQPPAAPALPDQVRVKNVLQEQFNREELRSLCFDLGVDWDDLEGSTLSIKAISLVGYFQRRSRLAELVAAMRTARPGAL
jgi:Effector-associated domain 7